MKEITINGQKLRVSAAEQRCLKTLARQDYAALKGDFVEGSGNYQRSTLPKDRDRRSLLGIDEIFVEFRYTHARSRKFFQQHPRCYSGIFGNPRRVNAILRKLGSPAWAEDAVTLVLASSFKPVG